MGPADELKEGGGVGVSYTNGIGSPQQFQQVPSAAEPAASSSANRTAKTEAGAASVSASATFGNAVPVDEAKVSTAAGMIAQAMSGSDVRTEKVAALQQAIDAGTYSVSSSDVADKVIGSMLR
jgi:negative regulator of flagellin synthesis FlgM